MRDVLITLLALSTFASPTYALAKNQPDSPSCTSIVDAAERLACYDSRWPPVANSQTLESLREKATQEFGLNRVQVRAKEPAEIRALQPERIQSTVASINYRATGERILRLDNGQVWLLTEGGSKGRLVIGDKVLLRTAALGSYMLVTPGHVNLRARRLQ